MIILSSSIPKLLKNSFIRSNQLLPTPPGNQTGRQSIGAHPTGRMSWDEASDFAGSLVYPDSVRATTWDDWRLPSANIPGTNSVCISDFFNTELGHLYKIDGLRMFQNVSYSFAIYWTSSEIEISTSTGVIEGVYVYNQFSNYHYPVRKSSDSPALWLVRDGDVGVVPEPSGAIFIAISSVLMCGKRGERSSTAGKLLLAGGL